jgi:hypothetical protein
MHNKASHGGPVVTTRTTSTPVATTMDIEGQGSIPYAKTENVSIPSAPKGEMTVRGFGLQMRATKFVLR